MLPSLTSLKIDISSVLFLQIFIYPSGVINKSLYLLQLLQQEKFSIISGEDIYEQLDLFTDPKNIQKERELEKTINNLKKKFGKNSVLRGMNYQEKATARQRNLLIGGHNSGEEE